MLETFSPQKILQENGLRLTDSQISAIHKKMPPADTDGQRHSDAVFEGGGVRGIAFLGALRCCDDIGIRWRKLAGTSAGAITASLLAANFSMEQLEDAVGKLDYMRFLTKKNSPLILNGDPSDDLQFPLQLMMSLAAARQIGEYSSDPFRDWLAETLQRANVKTFRDIETRGDGRELKVVVSDITRAEMLVLPDDLNKINTSKEPTFVQQLKLNSAADFSIAEAVRLSMSIPLFFTPGRLGKSMIVDGGILSNFPLWIYDKQPGYNPQLPRWFTFGFRFIDRNLEKNINIYEPFSLLSATFGTMLNARDRYHRQDMDKDRVINIDVSEAKVTTTEFNLSADKKNSLYRLGYLAAKTFFLDPSFSWEQHLISRGFGPLLQANANMTPSL
jgi:NTE family protein